MITNEYSPMHSQQRGSQLTGPANSVGYGTVEKMVKISMVGFRY